MIIDIMRTRSQAKRSSDVGCGFQTRLLHNPCQVYKLSFQIWEGLHIFQTVQRKSHQMSSKWNLFIAFLSCLLPTQPAQSDWCYSSQARNFKLSLHWMNFHKKTFWADIIGLQASCPWQWRLHIENKSDTNSGSPGSIYPASRRPVTTKTNKTHNNPNGTLSSTIPKKKNLCSSTNWLPSKVCWPGLQIEKQKTYMNNKMSEWSTGLDVSLQISHSETFKPIFPAVPQRVYS